jgi:transcription initiation factor IIE alpha subunit
LKWIIVRIEIVRDTDNKENNLIKRTSDLYSIDRKLFSYYLETISSKTTNENTHWLINKFLARLETLQHLDTTLTTQNDSANDKLEKKLKDIVEQLQMCLTKLRANSFSNPKNVISDNK